ncbi:hypothetical protein GGH13_009604, partial [Coemansia sp. S155-1]
RRRLRSCFVIWSVSIELPRSPWLGLRGARTPSLRRWRCASCSTGRRLWTTGEWLSGAKTGTWWCRLLI